MKFSVIIPTLREEKRIGALLAALEAQTFGGEWEILVCDGGSQDQTRAQVEKFSRAQFLDCERGVSRQRNAGARVAQGELLVFMDADDMPPPRFLEQIARSYARWPFSVACPWFFAHDGSFFTRCAYFGFNIGFWLGQSTLRTGSGVCIVARRRDFLKSGGFDETMHLGEDVKLLRTLCPRYGWHRHLLVPLGTSGRRFEHDGGAQLLWFYAKISPFLLLGMWKTLQKFEYRSAPYGEARRGKGKLEG